MNITELIKQMNCGNTTDEEEIFEEISKIDNPEDLHRIILNYNWDDGFELPQKVLDNKNCETTTALTIFFLAEGDEFLQEKSKSAYDEEWYSFVYNLYKKIIDGKFKQGEIKFAPPLNKLQIYKLKKVLENEEFIFIEETGTKEII